MRKVTPWVRYLIMTMAVIAAAVAHASAQGSSASHKVSPLAAKRAALVAGTSRVIVSAVDGASLPTVTAAIHYAGGSVRSALPIINAYVADLPNAALQGLADNPGIRHIAVDRVILGSMERTGATVGATAARQDYGYDGSGVGVAVIDSGVTGWHDDLAGPDGSLRIDRFVDFVNGSPLPYDDYGHGTHVAGIIAGNGFDSGFARSGIAPGARIISLKVLDGSGAGTLSNVIAALDYVLAHKDELNIRVVNLSIGSGVYESYNLDPLTLAAQQVVNAGIVVVAAAGNHGRISEGHTWYGGITSPGNAPWVLTVGASSHMGTVDRTDDTMAVFSSHGPTAIDYGAKPDVVAPGVGIESLSDPTSTMYTTQAAYLLSGTVQTSYLPYLSQSGTSMSAPVVTGTVALMLQANPSLTPNEVKAILQYTAQVDAAYDPLTEGAGFLNAKGAVDLARFFAAPSGTEYPSSVDWGTRLIWGNRLVHGGRLTASANAWSTGLTWGASATADGQSIEWGEICATASCDSGGGMWTVWSTAGDFRNVVWGAYCGGNDCQTVWGTHLIAMTDGDTVVWGTTEGDTVVWGTTEGDTVVWGTTDGDTVVWGTIQGDTVVWGTIVGDTVVWGTSFGASCQPVIWPHE